MRCTMGRYIAELDAEGRDRLIAAPEFNDGALWWSGDCGCLVGTAANWPALSEEQRTERCRVHASTTWKFGNPWAKMKPATRYPCAVTRFGKDRVVRAIKLRAAKLNGCSPEQIASIVNRQPAEPSCASPAGLR